MGGLREVTRGSFRAPRVLLCRFLQVCLVKWCRGGYRERAIAMERCEFNVGQVTDSTRVGWGAQWVHAIRLPASAFASSFTLASKTSTQASVGLATSVVAPAAAASAIF